MSDKFMAKDAGDVETIVGPSVKVEGDFVSEGNIVVQGQVSGTIKTSKQLRVEEGSVINANITADSSLVAGEVRGNMTLGSTVELTPTARVYGDIKTKTLIVAAGALVHGQVLMDETEKGRKPNKKGETYDDLAVVAA